MPPKKSNQKSNQAPAPGRSRRKRAQRRMRRVQNAPPSLVKQYSSIPFRGQGIKNLALTIAAPGDTPALRFPSISAPRTSVAALKDQFSVVTQAAYAPHGFSAGDTMFALFGQPNRMIMYYAAYDSPAAITYVISFDSTGPPDIWPINPGGALVVPVGGTGATGLTSYWTPVFGTPSDPSAPYGNTLPIGVSGDVAYVFMDINDEFNFNVDLNAAVRGTLYYVIHRYSGPEQGPAESFGIPLPLTSGAGTVNFVAQTPGYYSIALAGYELGVSGAIEITVPINAGPKIKLITPAAAGAGHWYSRGLADLDPALGGDINMAGCSRVNAASLLITNTTSLMNRQGTVLAARLGANELFGPNAAGRLARAAEKYSGDAALGCYTFKDFSDWDETFRDHIMQASMMPPPNYGLSFDLDCTNYTHVILISGTSVENRYTVTLSAQLEFRTDVARYAKGVAADRFDDLCEARKVINSEETWFYENPLHMRQIYGFLKSAIRSIGKMAPYAAAVGSLYNPAGAASYQTLAHALQGIQL